MMDKCERCTPAFGDEWEKRMLARTNIADYVDVYVRVYEKYLTREDVTELIALQEAKKASQPSNLSPRLKEKLSSLTTTMTSETIGGCAQIGAKLGGDIGGEIEKEHPEYMKPPAKESNPQG